MLGSSFSQDLKDAYGLQVVHLAVNGSTEVTSKH